MNRSAALTLALIALPLAARAEGRIYSYEPASDAARTLAETGLSFEFARTLLGGARVRRVIQTGDQGSAAVRLASESELGAGGLKTALAGQAASTPSVPTRKTARPSSGRCARGPSAPGC
jgi:hypothetical protein